MSLRLFKQQEGESDSRRGQRDKGGEIALMNSFEAFVQRGEMILLLK